MNTKNLNFFQLNRRGFSLLELIIVLSLTSVFLAITFPSLNNYLADRRLESACLILQQDIRSTGQVALVTESGYYRINLYREADKYRMLDVSRPADYREVVLPPGVDLVWTNFHNDVINFSARGMPAAGGHISLRSEQTGKFMYVIVAAVSGRTRVGEHPPIGYE